MALYQRARPITFAEVVGQEHVKDVLSAAIARGRLGHAYLFSGPRGVGKTTSARLLAMAVNCEAKGEQPPPCGVCESCRLIQAGNHPDVTELDAASNNSVEDVRDLREKVSLASIRGGMRVWILDEAHMLSKAAANALLKTLEEPPSQLIFILATTEPERLPPTIVSRCQHYRFRRLAETEIAGKLQQLAVDAEVTVSAEALQLMARAADGAMRDGESLLERLLSSGASIDATMVENALGLPPQGRIEELARALVNDDIASLLELAGTLYQAGFAPRSLAQRLKATLRDALYTLVGVGGYQVVLEIAQDDLLRVIHALDDGMDAFVRHDDRLTLEALLIKARNTLRHNVPSSASTVPASASPSSAASSMSQSATSSAQESASPSQVSKSQASKSQASKSSSAPQSSTAGLPEFHPTQPRKQRSVSPQTPAAAPSRAPDSAMDWQGIQRQVGGILRAFMLPAKATIEGKHLRLQFSEDSTFHHERLLKERHTLLQLMQQRYGDGVKLTIISPQGQQVTLPKQGEPPTTATQEPAPQKKTKPHGQTRAPEPVAQARPSAPPAQAKEISEATPEATPEEASVGYAATHYEEALPADFWDSPSSAPANVAEPAPKPAPMQGTPPQGAPTQGAAASPMVLSAQASQAQGLELPTLLKHFPGKIIAHQLPGDAGDVADANDTELNDTGLNDTSDDARHDARGETGQPASPASPSQSSGMTDAEDATDTPSKPIAAEDALRDIDALAPNTAKPTTPRDGITAAKDTSELNSAATQIPQMPEKAEQAKADTPQTVKPTEAAEAADDTADKDTTATKANKDKAKKDAGDYASPLFS